MQAIGTFGATAADVGRRLGVSKQAAGKTIDRLAELGYVSADGESADRRRKLVRLTPRGTQALALSAESFAHVRARWAAQLGADRVAALEADLRDGGRAAVPPRPPRLARRLAALRPSPARPRGLRCGQR